MRTPSTVFAFVLGGFIFSGLTALALIAGHAALEVKAHERSVEVKGLAEREVPADIVIWPLSYQLASNDLNDLFESIAQKNQVILDFLADHGLDLADVNRSPPNLTSWLPRFSVVAKYDRLAAICWLLRSSGSVESKYGALKCASGTSVNQPSDPPGRSPARYPQTSSISSASRAAPYVSVMRSAPRA